MKNIVITQAKANDIIIISDIENKSFNKLEGASGKTLKERFELFPENFFIAKIDNKIIGHINGCTTDKPILQDELYSNVTLHKPNGAYQTVFGLAVLPEYRHYGVASKLMNEFICVMRSRGKKGIVLTCKDYLIPFYERLGYTFMGVANSTHGNAVWNTMLIEF